ncbi:chloramphenicol phosphotransferase [Desertihabitans brevis]|uniref:Chloramphenicol phosphotransferase n=1 Tax=Desertihabitans brevis TaxID=2268447 RepID=A0A367YWB7_9ACTN|nr:chloramphenicol phosphotransferase [Desertihabitans brevis]RCK70196.1 chloramphenicol phosphotransferase [Desertihabitans brevis]
MTGHLIALVGTSSVGKTSAAAALQPLLPEPHLVVGIDLFLNAFPHHWAGHPRGPGPGMWYDDRTDADGRPVARIHYGEAGVRLLAGMRLAVRALLDAGNHVVLDEMPLDQTVLPGWRRDLAGYDQHWVRLTASLPALEERERGRRSGQHLGNARGHLDVVGDEPFDLVLDTSELAPAEVAERVRASLPADWRRLEEAPREGSGGDVENVAGAPSPG